MTELKRSPENSAQELSRNHRRPETPRHPHPQSPTPPTPPHPRHPPGCHSYTQGHSLHSWLSMESDLAALGHLLRIPNSNKKAQAEFVSSHALSTRETVPLPASHLHVEEHGPAPLFGLDNLQAVG